MPNRIKDMIKDESIRKPATLMLLKGITVGGNFLKIYLLSKLGVKTLGATTLIGTLGTFLIDPFTTITGQNVIYLSEEYGKIKRLKENEQVNDADSLLPNEEELNRNIGIILRQGWVLASVASIPSILILTNIKNILVSLGQDPDVSNIVGAYYLPAAFAIPVEMYLTINENLFSAVDKQAWLIPYKFGVIIIGIALNASLIPSSGITGAGIALFLQNFLAFIYINLFMLFKKDFKPFEIFSFSRESQNTIYLIKMIKQGWPLFLSRATLNGANFVIVGFMGKLGDIRLAVEQLALQYQGISVTITTGIADATNRLVAQKFGAKQYDVMRSYGMKGLVASGGLYLIISLPFNFLSLQLASAFLDNTEIEKYTNLIRYTFVLTTVNQFLSLLQDICSSNLAAMEDTFFSFASMLATTLAITLPLSTISLYLTNFDLYGISSALIVGLSVASAANFTYWRRQANYAVTTNSFDVNTDTSNAKVSTMLTNSIRFFSRPRKRALEAIPLDSRPFISPNTHQNDRNVTVQRRRTL
jgi:multidrug resistance protein, MATE family